MYNTSHTSCTPPLSPLYFTFTYTNIHHTELTYFFYIDLLKSPEMHHQDVSSSSVDSTPETQENDYEEIDIAGDGGNDTAEQTDTTAPDTTGTHDDERPNPVTVSIEECSDIPTNDPVIDGLERQIAEMSRESDQANGCCKFYRSNIVGHFISGIMTGALFVLIGVIFTVNSSTFPVYVGIILIVMGIVPCCLAVNR